MKITKYISILSLFALPFLSGCRVINYENQSDGRKIFYGSFGLNTSLGKLDIVTPQGSHVLLENHSSDSTAALDVLGMAVSKIPSPSSGGTSRTTVVVPRPQFPPVVAPQVQPKPPVTDDGGGFNPQPQ